MTTEPVPQPVLAHGVETKRNWSNVPDDINEPIVFVNEIKCRCGLYFQGEAATLVMARQAARKKYDEHVTEVVPTESV